MLELGTGYGRLIPALIGDSRELVGIDRERSLLRLARRRVAELPLARRKLVKLMHGDMERFELAEKFDRIVAPYNVLYCLPGKRALLRCLRCVAAHLDLRGALLFDVWCADAFAPCAASSHHHDERGSILSLARGGQTWDVFESSRLTSARQRLDVTYTYIERRRGTRVSIGIPQRYWTSRQLIEALSAAGLRVDALWGGFDQRPFRRGSEHLIVRASAR